MKESERGKTKPDFGVSSVWTTLPVLETPTLSEEVGPSTLSLGVCSLR